MRRVISWMMAAGVVVTGTATAQTPREQQAAALAQRTQELRAAMQSRVDEIVEIQSSGASMFPVVEFDAGADPARRSGRHRVVAR